MTVLPIRAWPDPVLSMRASPVDATEDVAELARDMLDTMYAAPGRGLAAPQVGVLARLFVMDTTWKEGARDPLVCINPDIVALSEEMATMSEGCLSIEGVSLDVTRPAWVDLAWSDLEGVRHQRRFEGFAAACVQHEYDHLEGCVTFDRVSPTARAAAVATYETYLETTR
ncbi:peptide deformylase [Phaeobacter gallaeciensis]|uniref:Peptide deformylase n=1 Tax=Phaeobacter gallaeciensis TaxID=60890 RepID=A0AAC9Z5F3_9RHOB|nr:peptide deformylase [Phaeobacter gallaeciensis]AHD08022.1 peptide deformylase [Phaeobacter gallaeciensis DSM 26640]ATE91288.1 peptide deformylase [Phaeobacter gallaeciensis]ATE95564.1 peptide deformylase [Phaeobacter gallaeciensis]ATE99903.1 peptide deformylase [Phaeobacter gallaeciensis]ATF04336.1 peptide deformylase [Phaeobacter gallaeciensis]